MNPNVLRQWMRLYDQQGLGGPSYASAGDGRFVPVRDDNANSRRMMFAERMAGMGGGEQQMPDFFGSEAAGPPNVLAGYREPRAFAPDEHMAPPARQQRPMNVLARMGGRNGYRS